MSDLYKDLPLTLFPQNTDSFLTYLDIVAQDGPLVKQYAEAIQNGDASLASQILAQIPNATQKIIKANDLNKLVQSILAVERFYKTDVQPYIEERQTEWRSLVNQFNYRGTWSNGVSYQNNNMVSYTIFGVEYIYIAVKNVPVGVAPTDTQFWKRLTIQGKQGTSGVGLSYRYQWQLSSSYVANDAVTYDGALWMAIKPSQGVEPSRQSDSWRLVMTLAATTYPIQDTAPINQEAGDLWFNTSGNPTKFYYLETLQNPATADDIAQGKEAYDEFGHKIVGTGTGTGGDTYWNDDSALYWN